MKETISLNAAEPEAIEWAAELIRSGRLVAFPTETVYGLGADALNPAAVKGIFEAKARPASDPIIVHVAELSAIEPLVRRMPDEVERLAGRFWPGPLTLILPRSERVPDEITAGGETVAVRIPNHPIALGLIRAADTPIGAPSANRFSQTSPTTAEHVRTGLGGRIDMVLDGGPTSVGVESTVLNLTGAVPEILRPGGVTAEDLALVLPDVVVKKSVIASTETGLISPGLLDKHYAPETEMWLFDGEAAHIFDQMAYAIAVRPPGRVALMLADEDHDARFENLLIQRLGPISRLDEVARNLYRNLREVDQLDVDLILCRHMPEWGIGAAIRDRLSRAATRRFD